MTIKSSNPVEFNAWRSARHRCSSPTSRAWKNYGGRGIRMCATWAGSFESFLEHMGKCPVGYSLDRIDNDRGYEHEPGNCRWTTPAEQTRNQRGKITEEQARWIHMWVEQGFSIKAIAGSMGVREGAVAHIKGGTSWRDLAHKEAT